MAGDLISARLVAHWTEFVDWDKRSKSDGEFYNNLLRENCCRTVMNAALGDGYSSVQLAKAGFDVTSNEIDDDYLTLALANAKRHNVELNVTRENWLSFSRIGRQFDAAMCLGNSFSLLSGYDDLLRAFTEIHAVIKPGGIFILDQRDFDYMLDKRTLRSDFRYSKRITYCGENVDAYPISISENELVVEYKHRDKGVVGHLTLFPLRVERVRSLLEQAGFSGIRQFGDLVENKRENVDFIQWVAKA